MQSRHPHLVKRKGSRFYHFHSRIPPELQGHYEGRKSIRISLKTDDADEALRQADKLAAQWKAEFIALQAMLLAEPPPVPLAIAEAMLPKLAQALEEGLQRIERKPGKGGAQGPDDAAFGALIDRVEAVTQETAAADAQSLLPSIRESLADWMQNLHMGVTLDSALGRYLARKYLEARLKAVARSGHRGSAAAIAEVDQLQALLTELHPVDEAALDSGSPRLAAVVDYWETTGPQKARTLGAAANLVKRFVALHGDIPLASITPEHFVALRDAMLTEVKPATITTKFNLLRGAFAACIDDRQFGIGANPMQHVKIRADTEGAGRVHFSVDQLQTIFDAPLFTASPWRVGAPEGANKVAGIGKSDTAFWLPLLGLFTGAHLEELLHLRTKDLRTEGGVTLIHLRHRPAKGQKAATQPKRKAQRVVPVHPELVRLGLLTYSAHRARSGPWLFPATDVGALQPARGDVWSKWFGRFLDGLALHDEGLMFHSFHHTFNHFAQASGVTEAIRDAITGRLGAKPTRTAARRPNHRLGIHDLAQAIDQLQFGSLDLSKVNRWEATGP